LNSVAVVVVIVIHSFCTVLSGSVHDPIMSVY
jgi:hypothetical protein